MPTYEYRCSSCEHTWDAFHSIKQDPLKICPKCGKPTAVRLISSKGAFVLNGTGWAKDSYS